MAEENEELEEEIETPKPSKLPLILAAVAAFILGGAMNFGGHDSPLGQEFIDRIVQQTRKSVFPVLAERLVVRFAQLGSEAGFVGAAGLARAQLRRLPASDQSPVA